ncbi:MAG: hypothetical protein JSW58_03335 [Candidatus Latescibacterota bacterium]|nr:MAG: hypothetical protein JSW58_03335 [Candidatus Latescibacterota bacterium]
MKKKTRLLLLSVLAVFVIAAALIGVGSVSYFEGDHSGIVRQWKLCSKNIVMRSLYAANRIAPFAGTTDLEPPTPLHGKGYSYQDLSHPYFDTVRTDPRIRHLYQDPRMQFDDFVEMADFLRDQSPHGRSTISHSQRKLNLLALLDLADKGERFTCGTMSKMLAQMVQASGNFARLVFLFGHVVTEVWVPEFEKWVLIDPLFNVHYLNDKGVPLSALDLHRMINAGAEHNIHPRPGNSPNTVFTERAPKKQLYECYKMWFAVSFFDKWVSHDLPRWSPYGSPVITGVYYNESGKKYDAVLYYAKKAADPSELYHPPKSYQQDR